MKNNKNVRKDNLSPVDNSTKRVYKMYKSKKNWVVAPVVLLTLLGAVAPAPIALSNVVNAATTEDAGNTKEEDTTVTVDAATVAAKKDAESAIKNLELPKSLTQEMQNRSFKYSADGVVKNDGKYATQEDYLKEVSEATTADAVFATLKKAYSQAAHMAYSPFNEKANAQKAKLVDINGLGDSFDPGNKFLNQFNNEFEATKTEVEKAYNKFVKELSVKAAVIDRTLGTESKPAENNYATVRKAFDDVLTAQTAKLSTIYDAAVEQGRVNTDYEAKKADTINRINALPNLTVSEKNLFLANINTIAADNEKAPSYVNWRKDLDRVIATATDANNLHVSNLMTNVMNYLEGKAKDTTVDEKAIPIFLSSSEVAKYKNKVNEFGKLTNVRDVPTNFNKVTDLQALFDQIKQANEEATIKFKLNELKQSYIAKINDKNDANYNLLKPEVRQGFVNRISSASVTTSAQVRDIFAEYEDELQIAILSQNSDLNTLKEKAYDEVNKDRLQNLDRLAIGNYQFAIKSASTKSEVLAIFKEAREQNRAILRAAQEAAVKEINALKYLNDQQKHDYITDITRDFDEPNGLRKDRTIADVATSLGKAKEADAKAHLELVKHEARKTVQGLKYLTKEQSYNYLAEIDSATSISGVEDIVGDAIFANFSSGIEKAKSVKEAQEIAREAIDTFTFLTAKEKSDALADLANAKSVSDVYTIFTAANASNVLNFQAAVRAAQLAKTKDNAVVKVNSYKYLTAEQKADYVSKIKAAENTDSVNKLSAQALNDDKNGFEEFKVLEAAKTAAIKQIRGLYEGDKDNWQAIVSSYGLSAYNQVFSTFGELDALTASQKAEYVGKILAANSLAEVDKLVDDAYFTNLNQITDVAKFNKIAKALINDSKYLNPSQKAGYINKLGASIENGKKVLKEAVNKGYEQNDKLVMKEIDSLLKSGLYNTAKTKLAALRLDNNIATYTAKVQGLLDLRTAKENAVNEINHANYVADKDKENLINDVNKAKSIDEVNKVLDHLKDLQPATVVQLYRAYNPNSGEHLYTADKAEYDKLVGLGWHGEGNAWKAASKGAPVYRLYNPNSGEHFYTVSESEYNDVAKAGWKKEGIAFYSDAKRGVEVYRLFNPNAKGAGSHHYTTLASERDTLIKAGWKYENVAFYGLK